MPIILQCKRPLFEALKVVPIRDLLSKFRFAAELLMLSVRFLAFGGSLLPSVIRVALPETPIGY